MAEQEKQEETPEQEAAPAEGGAPETKDAEQPQGAAPAEGEQQKESAAAPAAERRPARPGAGAAPAGPPTAVVAAGRQPGQPAVSRRSILRFGFWSGLGAIVAGAAACGVDMLYPRNVAGFGGRVSVDPSEVPQPGEKRPIQRGRFWLVNLTEEQGGPGVLALWWKCPHLGCTVPWKETFIWPDATTGADKQGWFRCPCHGSTFTDAGIRVFGPAPRSLDTMKLEVGSDGRIVVDTGNTTNGAPDNPDRAVRI
jgi:cytochrome b6-f complex iron-sulfur subunit